IQACQQITAGAHWLHSQKASHGDIHLENILYDEKKKRFDLADFGHAKQGPEKFSERVVYDLMRLKESIESILLGQEQDPLDYLLNGYKQRIQTIEQLTSLGFQEPIARLILNFMNDTPATTQGFQDIFKQIPLPPVAN